MKKIDIGNLLPGTVTSADLYTERGEHLISKGVTITDMHLGLLQRRNIFELYIQDFDEEEEIRNILARGFDGFDPLTFDDHSLGVLPKPKKEAMPKAYRLPQLSDIKFGREGLEALVESKKAKDLDAVIRLGFLPDKPQGAPLKLKAKQLSVQERNESYKAEMKLNYYNALQNVKFLMTTLAENKTIDCTVMRVIVERFVKVWLIDRSMLLNLASTKPTDEEYLFHHSLNTCLFAINIAAAAGYSEPEIVEIAIGAALHDVGMLLIAPEIRMKNGRLTKDEWYEIQKHPIIGLHLLEKVAKIPESTPYLAYQVHERENGQGYPKGRSGRFIHNYSKIVQVADIFEALSSPRHYRSAYLPYRAVEILIKMMQKKMVSGEYVKAFLNYLSLFPLGSIVELTDHRIGRVVQANELHYAKPLVSVIKDAEGNLLAKNKIYQLDLAGEPKVRIIRVIDPKEASCPDSMYGF